MVEFTKHLERAAAVGRGEVPVTAKQRKAAQAEAISRAGDLRAHVSLIEAVLVKLMATLYELNDASYPANYDHFTGQILIPLPWGKTGWALWGLRNWEADCLRRILLDRSKNPGAAPELFDYSDQHRRWFLDVVHYPTIEHALHWVKTYGPSAAEWQWSLDIYYAERAKRRGIILSSR